MINEIFKNKFPFAYNYFSTLTESKKDFPQSIILEGTDTFNSYYFALELARIQNCTGDKTPNCECTNCKWIKSYTHPAINNVSQIHFKPDGDETTTTISVKQVQEIEKTLALSSDYHRFFIFFSSKNTDENTNEFSYNEINYTIEPLTNQIFNKFAINAMLKSIEEPPKNTTFVFLVKSKEDIISTIVSRSQVFKTASIPNAIDYNDILPYLNDYFSLDYIKALDIANYFQNYGNTDLILNKLIAYLKDILIQQPSLQNKIIKDIYFISNAIKHLRASMSDKVVLEALFLKIARGY